MAVSCGCNNLTNSDAGAKEKSLTKPNSRSDGIFKHNKESFMFDTFNQSVSTLEISSDSIQEESPPETEPAQQSLPSADNRGQIFVYDLETVPDESAFPRPEPKSIEPRELDFAAVLKTADSVKAEIRTGITQDEAAALLESERAGKCRKTVVSELTKAVEESDRDLADWKKLAVDPWSCRIVAIGICWYGNNDVAAMTCQSVEQEIAALELFWNAAAEGIRCGYNIHGFDDRVIVARSIALGVVPSVGISLKRYDKSSIDLMRILFDGASPMKLKSLVQRMGIEVPAGETNGSHVLDFVDGGQWDHLLRYVQSDAIVEMELLRRVQKVVEF